jgi:hypothetical protein
VRQSPTERIGAAVFASLSTVVALCVAVGGPQTAAAAATTAIPGAVATASLPIATIDSTYSVTLSATGGTPPYQWSTQSGPVPPGLVLSSTGVLSGRPGTLGTTTVALRVTDSLGVFATRTFSFTVRPLPEGITLLTASGALETLSSTAPPVVTLAPAPTAVAVAVSPDGTRTWTVTATGTVIPVPGTPNFGSLARPPRHGVVAITADPDGQGYWIVTAFGHVYGFGTARGFGSVHGRPSGRVVAIAPSPSGDGYALVTSTGVVYSFGDAPRATAPRRLRTHAVGIAITPDGKGIFLAESGGVVLGFGSARQAKIRNPPVAGPVVAIAPAPSGTGYWLVTALGGVAPAGSAESLTPLPTPPGVVIAAASST